MTIPRSSGTIRHDMALLDRFRLDGKVAVVTAASRGIGQASDRRAVPVVCDLNDLANMRTLTEKASVLNDDLRRIMIGGTPLRRLGTVEDIAIGVVYLASDAGSFLTGKVLEIDGGLTFPNLALGLPDL